MNKTITILLACFFLVSFSINAQDQELVNRAKSGDDDAQYELGYLGLRQFFRDASVSWLHQERISQSVQFVEKELMNIFQHAAH